MTVLILGDPHIERSLSIGKAGLGTELNSRVADQIKLLEWTLEQALEHLVTNIIITGDCFENPKPTSSAVSIFISWLKKCADNNINVHIIAGNHDILRSGQFYVSALDIISAADMEKIYVYKSVSTIHIDGASFTLLPFRDRRSFNTNSNTEAINILKSKLPYELAEIDKDNFKVLIGHLTLENAIPAGDEIDDMANELQCPLDMFKGYDYVWMGHVHKPQVLSQKPYISHIGSMDLSDFGESEHKKVIVVFDPKKDVPYKYIEIPTRPLKQITITIPEDTKNTTGYILTEIQSKYSNLNKAIVRLNIILSKIDLPSIDRAVIEKEIYNCGAFNLCRLSEERRASSIVKKQTDAIDNTVTEKAAIKMYSDLFIDSDSQQYFISLANEIVDEFKETRDK